MHDSNPITSLLPDWASAERDANVEVLDRWLTDDFVAVGPLGFTLDKPAWLERHRHGDLRYSAFSLEEVNARSHGDSIIVTARQTTAGTYRGAPLPEAVRATLVLVTNTDGWRLAGIHMSFIAGTAGSPPLPGGARSGSGSWPRR